MQSALFSERQNDGACTLCFLQFVLGGRPVKPVIVIKLGEASLDIEAVSLAGQEVAKLVRREKAGILEVLKDRLVKFGQAFYFSPWRPLEPWPSGFCGRGILVVGH